MLEKQKKKKKQRKKTTLSHRVRLTLWTTPALHCVVFVSRKKYVTMWCLRFRKNKTNRKSSIEWILRILRLLSPPGLDPTTGCRRMKARSQVEGWRSSRRTERVERVTANKGGSWKHTSVVRLFSSRRLFLWFFFFLGRSFFATSLYSSNDEEDYQRRELQWLFKQKKISCQLLRRSIPVFFVSHSS